MSYGKLWMRALTNWGRINDYGDHIERKKGHTGIYNSNIDESRTYLNFTPKGLVTPSRKGIRERINARIREACMGQNVEVVEVYSYTSWRFMASLTPEQQREYFEDCYKWIEEHFDGRENIITARVHMDQTTPHMHVFAMPIREGKLCTTSFVGGQRTFRKIKDDYCEKVLKKWGQEWGEPVEESAKRRKMSVTGYKATPDSIQGTARTAAIEEFEDIQEWIKAEVKPAMREKGDGFSEGQKHIEIPEEIGNRVVAALEDLIIYTIRLTKDFECLKSKIAMEYKPIKEFEALKFRQYQLATLQESMRKIIKVEPELRERYNKIVEELTAAEQAMPKNEF